MNNDIRMVINNKARGRRRAGAVDGTPTAIIGLNKLVGNHPAMVGASDMPVKVTSKPFDGERGLTKAEKQAADQQRAILRQFMLDRQLTLKGWCRQARLSPGSLRNFLMGRSHSLTGRSLNALAHAAHVPLIDLLVGDETLATKDSLELIMKELRDAVVYGFTRLERRLANIEDRLAGGVGRRGDGENTPPSNPGQREQTRQDEMKGGDGSSAPRRRRK